MILAAFLVAALSLAGCASLTAHEAEVHFPGMSRLDMERCAGIPRARDKVAGVEIDTYTYETKGSGVSMGLPLLGTLSLSTAGSCTAVWALTGDKVLGVRFTAASGGVLEPESACSPLVAGCLAMLREQGRSNAPYYDFMSVKKPE